jgi:hypothetical protein
VTFYIVFDAIGTWVFSITADFATATDYTAPDFEAGIILGG